MIRLDATLLSLLLVAVLVWIYIRNRQSVRQERAGIYNACRELFQDVKVSQDDINFPVLQGKYRAWDVELVPIVDHIAVRKIPSLWLQVTVKTPVPFDGTVDFLVRPQNVEFYSPSSLLDTDLQVPKGWPAHAVLRTDNIDAMPPEELITPHMTLFEDEKMKELLITPRGVRLVYQLDQATRSHYMVLRQLRFENFKIAPQLAGHLLDGAIAIAETLKTAEAPTQGEP